MRLLGRGRALAIALVALASMSVLVGCGGDDDSGTTSEATSTTSTAKATELDVRATDYAFSGSPASIKAGVVHVKLTDASQKEAHQLVFAKLEAGKTLDDFRTAASSETGNPFAVGTDYGGISGTFPGTSSSATVVLPAGSYVMYCTIPAPDGQPHVAKGMIAPLQVTAGDDDAALPDAPETITGRDFGFDVPDGFTGHGAVEFVNESTTQTHELVLFELADGKTGNDVLSFFGPDAPAGPPPFTAVTGAASIHPGGKEIFEPDLGPGHYFLACFVPDADTHKPHFMLGMVKELTIS
jgi:hypothetical protein